MPNIEATEIDTRMSLYLQPITCGVEGQVTVGFRRDAYYLTLRLCIPGWKLSQHALPCVEAGCNLAAGLLPDPEVTGDGG